MTLVLAWFRAFLLTCGIELVVAPWVLGTNAPLARRLALVFFAQLVSHPLVWFVFPELRLGATGYVVAAETWAVVIEAVFYRVVLVDISRRTALAAAALANGISFGIGLLVKF
jgi:hypothetical protein